MSGADPFSETLDLLHRARSGDKQALGAVLDRYRPRLLARVRLMMGENARRVADSGDFLQSTLAAAIEGFERFEVRNETAFLRWLSTIARNNIRMGVRRRREVAFSALSTELLLAEPATPSDDHQDGDVEERLLRLVEAIETLPEDQRLVVELHSLEKCTFKEVGAHLGKSEDAARRLHAKALLSLAERLLPP